MGEGQGFRRTREWDWGPGILEESGPWDPGDVYMLAKVGAQT